MEDKTVFLRMQPLPQQLYAAYLEHTLTGLRQLFIVATVAPVATEPSKGAFNYPTPFDNLETPFACFLSRQFQADVGIRFRPRGEPLITIDMVPQHFHQAGK